MTPRRAFERWMVLAACAALALTAFAYPLGIENAWFSAIEGWFRRRGDSWIAFFDTQLRPLLLVGYSPLVLKETLGAVCAVAMFIGYWPWRIFFADRRQEARGIHLPLLILIAFAGVSLIWTPSLNTSVRTLEAMIPGLLFFLMVSDLDWQAGGRRKLLAVLAAIGAVQVAVGLMQIIPGLNAIYYRVFFRFDDPRNAIPGWIGHNTEMASYVLSCALAMLALLLMAKRLWVKILLGLLLIGAAVVIIATQSRAIWPLSLVLMGWLFIAGRRELGQALRWWHFLGAVVVVLALALPFAPQLRQRVKQYSPAAMQAETRARILFASQSLIRQEPLLGHGIGSFSAVYPRAQALYFARHPDTRLVPTEKRTPQAHNDYLQLAVELGVPGLLLALAGILIYMRQGAQGMKRLQDPAGRLTALVFGLIAIQHLLNATVNFPVHVAPAAYLLALALGVWVAVGREAALPQAEASRLPVSSSARIGLLVVALLPLAVLPVLLPILSRELVITTNVQMGSNYVFSQSQLDMPDRTRAVLLDRAEQHLMRAQRMDPLDWESKYFLAWINLIRGQLMIRQAERIPPLASEQERAWAAGLRANAEFQLKQGMRLLDESEVQFHQSHYIFAQLYQEMDRLYPGQYLENVRENLEWAVLYSPVYYDALEALLRYYTLAEPGELERRFQLAQQMRALRPEQFMRDMMPAVWADFIHLDYAQAVQRLDFLVEAFPDDPDLRANRVAVLIYAGQTERAIAALADYERRFGRTSAFWDSMALVRLAQGRDDEALRIALEHGAQANPPSQNMAAIASLILKHQGQDQRALALAQKAWEAGDAARVTFLGTRAQLAHPYPRFSSEFIQDAEALLATGYAPANTYAMLAQKAFERGDYALADEYILGALQHGFSASRMLQALAQQVERARQSAAPATLPATSQAMP